MFPGLEEYQYGQILQKSSSKIAVDKEVRNETKGSQVLLLAKLSNKMLQGLEPAHQTQNRINQSQRSGVLQVEESAVVLQSLEIILQDNGNSKL